MRREVVIVTLVLFLLILSTICGVWLVLNRPQRQLSIPSRIALGRSNGIGVVYLYGPMSVSRDGGGFMARLTGTDAIVEQLKVLAKDDRVRAVVLRINSGGGTVAAVQEVHNAVQDLKAHGKKVVASFGDVAASGAYYVACACDRIIANPGTITGSIGVIFSVGNVEGLFRKIGVKIEVLKSGKYKDIGSGYREMTEEERGLLKAMLDSAYSQFVEAVRTGRGFSGEKVKEVAQGQLFTGAQALEAGLVDKIGSYEDAVKEAAELTGIKGEPEIIEAPMPFFKRLLSYITESLGWHFSPQKLAEENSPRLEYRMW